MPLDVSFLKSVMAWLLFSNMLIDKVPLTVTMVIMGCGICGLVFLKYMYTRENNKRASAIVGWDESDFAAEATSEDRRGDQRRTFIYAS